MKKDSYFCAVNKIANTYNNWEFKLIGSSQLGSNNLSANYAKMSLIDLINWEEYGIHWLYFK